MGFITDFVNYLVEQALVLWTSLFTSLGENVFFIEKTIGKTLNTETIDNLYRFTQAAAYSFLVIKILQKGFMTYILWRDGDPDVPIIQTIQNIALAIVCSVGFPTLYVIFAEVSLWMLENYTAFLFQTIEIDTFTMIVGVQMLGSGIGGIVMLIYVIMLFVLYLQLLKRGGELLILRIGFPLACVGMVDSDKGALTPMIKSFIQVALTTIVQLFLICLSMVIIINAGDGFQIQHLFLAISFCMMAFSTPPLLNNILLQVSGGGVGGAVQKVGGVAHTITAVRNLLGK